eukprot:10225454-Heterocapsa_arctica.AAC.1
MFAHQHGALMTMHPDDILLAESDALMAQREKELNDEMKIKWGHVLDPEWRKYLGREWRKTEEGEYQFRIPDR